MNEFGNIIGHKQIIQHFSKAFKERKVSHAYILEGDDGMGKMTLTKAFVKLLQCEEAIGTTSCNVCSSCVQVDSNNHPDIKYVVANKKSGYGVEDIRRQVVNDVNVKPYGNKYKIYIIDDADNLNIAAQNSMLKTIEEPPEYAVFFLLVKSKYNLLDTILSRAVKMTLKPVEQVLIKNFLIDNYNLNEVKAETISLYSRGNIGKAIELVESESFNEHRNEMLEVLDVFINHKEYDIMEAVKILEKNKEHMDEMLVIIVSIIHDILYYLETYEEAGIIHKDVLEQIKKLSINADEYKLYKLVQNSLKLKQEQKVNVNYSISILNMLIDI